MECDFEGASSVVVDNWLAGAEVTASSSFVRSIEADVVAVAATGKVPTAILGMAGCRASNVVVTDADLPMATASAGA